MQKSEMMKNQSKKLVSSILLTGLLFFLGSGCLKSESAESTEDREPELVPFTLVEVDRDGPQDIFSKGFGDLNGNGLNDLIVGGNLPGGGGLVWYENPEWTRHDIDTRYRFGTDIEVADINGNGLLDVITIRHQPNRALVWYDNPNWTQHVVAEGPFHDLEVTDFDGDDKVEIVARFKASSGETGGPLYLFKQDQSPTALWNELSFTIPNGEGLKAADINGNGRKDIIVNGKWYENTGTFLDEAAWREHVYTDSWTHEDSFIDVGDINGNGRADIVLSPSERAGEFYRISWFESPEDPSSGLWKEHVINDNVEAVYHFIGLADFNRNGRLDVATAAMEQGEDPDEVKLYLNPGDNNTWRKQVLFTGGSHSMRILDVNNNESPDLFGANWRGKEVMLWVNLKK